MEDNRCLFGPQGKGLSLKSNMPTVIHTVTDRHIGKRLDIFISHFEPHISRSRIQTMIKEGLALVDGRLEKPGYKVKRGEVISIVLPEQRTYNVMPEPIPLNIVYEDSHIVAVNKPAGLVVHPAPGNYTGTLVNALLYHYPGLPSAAGSERAGLVHRLDKDTSGIMVIAKTPRALRILSEQFRQRMVQKRYLALVTGLIKKGSGVIEAAIGRHAKERKKISVYTRKPREAVTNYRVKERFGKATLLEVEIKTGRTHQIRVHLAHIGHPVLGDRVYGGVNAAKIGNLPILRQMLHAESLSIYHPETGHPITFIAPLPQDMAEIIGYLRKKVILSQ